MVNCKYFKSFKKKIFFCFGFGFILHCISLGLDFSNFFLVFQFWTLNFFINAGLWQSPLGIFAGSFKSQLIDYFRGAITSWELVEGSFWQFYDNET